MTLLSEGVTPRMLNPEPKVCARKAPNINDDGVVLDTGCDNLYQARTHNQKFCSSECTRIQTNANLMEKYYDNQRRKRGEERICDSCGFTKLSRWNPERTCSVCVQKPERDRDAAAALIMKERQSSGF